MVEVNYKLLAFVIFIDAMLLGFFSILPSSVTAEFTGARDTSNATDIESMLPTDLRNGTELSNREFVDGTGSSVWGFIKFMVFGGIMTVDSLPIYISGIVFTAFWLLHIFVILELVSFVRELIGFT